MTIKTTLASALASLTDALADLGAQAPHLAQLTVSAGGVTVTAQPKPPAPPPPATCPTCGR
jgi:hypothetical protein